MIVYRCKFMGMIRHLNIMYLLANINLTRAMYSTCKNISLLID